MIKSFNEFIIESESISYSGVVLDDKSRSLILKSLTIPEDWEIIAHHMTICFGPLPSDWKSRLGEKVTLSCSHAGQNDKALALKVDNFDRILKGTSHITVAINSENGAAPKDSNSITDWNKKVTLKLTGIIQEVPR